MIAVGDALAFVLTRLREFTPEDFARFHPAGSLGKKLVKVEAVMRQGQDLRPADSQETVRTVFAQARQGRRTRAGMLTGADGPPAGPCPHSRLAPPFTPPPH